MIDQPYETKVMAEPETIKKPAPSAEPKKGKASHHIAVSPNGNQHVVTDAEWQRFSKVHGVDDNWEVTSV